MYNTISPHEQSWNPELLNFANFAKLPKKNKLPDKFKLPDKRGFELTENKRANSCPPANPHS